jgi:hypothetical protein
MLLMGFWTPLHAMTVVTLLVAPWLAGAPRWAPLVGLAVLYLVPPLVTRAVLRMWGRGGPRATFGSGAFLRWWALSQLQLVFNRLPFLDELLRLVPGLYSTWLRLWGARIGRLVFWAPGVVITDRYLLDVGDGVLVGIGTRIVGHVFVGRPGTSPELLLAPVAIGARAMVGGFSMLGPGTRIAEGEAPPAMTVLTPFWTWTEGRRRIGPRVVP